MSVYIRLNMSDFMRGSIPIRRPALYEDLVIEIPEGVDPRKALDDRKWTDITSFETTAKGYRTFRSKPQLKEIPQMRWLGDYVLMEVPE